MPRLSIATLAVAEPMGAQVYQEEIAARASDALAVIEPGWRVERTIVRSMRAPLVGNRRLPMGFLTSASPTARRALGRLIYPRGAVVHRMNLELPPGSGPDVITLHDVVAWRFSDESAPVVAAAEEARRADAIICVSRFSAEEAVDLLGISDPFVVHNGVDPRFFDPEPANASMLEGLDVHGPFVLTAGGASRRKNLEGLAAAWPRVHSSRPDLTLVLSGPEHSRRTELFKGLPAVRMVGRVPDAVMPRLIAASSAVVVPSLYEGFGLPALEGMAAGVPVVAARTGSLPEVVGNGGILVDPTPDDLAQGVLYAVSGGAAIDAMVAVGRLRACSFTWEASAAGHARVWAALSH